MAPSRGKPPKAPSGYEPVRGNPFLFQPCVPDCEHRYLKFPDNKCCGQSPRPFCRIVEKHVGAVICNECQSNPEWVKNAFQETT